jgi:hypothetical protein
MEKQLQVGILMAKMLVGEAWKVVDGTLMLDPSQKEGWQIKGGGDIVT